MRGFPFKGFYDAVNQEGVDLYSLQLSDSSHTDVSKYNITDLEEYLTDWEQTAGAIANLDLVITSCTSVAHLSHKLYDRDLYQRQTVSGFTDMSSVAWLGSFFL